MRAVCDHHKEKDGHAQVSDPRPKYCGKETRLGLLRLLLLLLCLSLGDGGQPRLGTGLSSLVPLGGDGGKVSADNTTLVLHGLARALLGNLLCDTLLVHATVELCPGDLARVLALEEKRLILRGGEAEDLKEWEVMSETILG